MLLNDPTADYEWFCNDEAGYMAEQHRRDAIVEKAIAEHMGDEFAQAPLPEREELENDAVKLSEQLAALHRLKAPSNLVGCYQEMLAIVIDNIKQGRYIVTKEERDYSKRYWDRRDSFSFTGDWN